MRALLPQLVIATSYQTLCSGSSMKAENEGEGNREDCAQQEERVPRGGSGGSAGFSPAALRRQMQRSGFTVEDVADQIGLTRQAVSAWLTGRTTPSPRSLARVAALLDVTTADLTPGVGPESSTLQDMRIRAGFSQSVVAQELGLLQSMLSDIERGRRDLHMGTAQRLSGLYGLSVDEVADAWEIARAGRREHLAARRRRNS